MYQRIRDLREDADLKQKDVAEYLHCSQVSYSYYEIGRRAIPVEVLIQLADFYGVTLDYLVGRSEEGGPGKP
ncbi:MAG: helix-turn-helix transcriptional regulator [Ruminococcaceae bacterium]|nr:helix-turn-helix transcriptional regulator [Oscillospiraceae bacterium]